MNSHSEPKSVKFGVKATLVDDINEPNPYSFQISLIDTLIKGHIVDSVVSIKLRNLKEEL